MTNCRKTPNGKGYPFKFTYVGLPAEKWQDGVVQSVDVGGEGGIGTGEVRGTRDCDWKNVKEVS